MIFVGELANMAKGMTPPLTDNQPSSVSSAPFSSFLQSLANQNEVLNEKAASAVTGLITGQGVDVHDVLIATQKASLAFELSLEIRNKAVAAYQQMMGMQF